MTHAEFLRRARNAGCRIDVSGSVMFVSNGDVTIKIDERGHLTHRDPKTTNEFAPVAMSYAQASKLLKLPRR